MGMAVRRPDRDPRSGHAGLIGPGWAARL